MKILAILTIALALAAPVLAQDDLGNLSDNPYAPDSSSGLANQYNPNSVSNPLRQSLQQQERRQSLRNRPAQALRRPG